LATQIIFSAFPRKQENVRSPQTIQRLGESPRLCRNGDGMAIVRFFPSAAALPHGLSVPPMLRPSISFLHVDALLIRVVAPAMMPART